MKIKDEKIEVLSMKEYFVTEYCNEEIIIENCIINILDFDSIDFEKAVIIRNCLINKFLIYACWFEGGLEFRNNIIRENINYDMGGHNKKEVIIEGNLFLKKMEFLDCHFEAIFILRDNIFIEGTSLLGNIDEGYANTFDEGLTIDNNIGDLD